MAADRERAALAGAASMCPERPCDTTRDAPITEIDGRRWVITTSGTPTGQDRVVRGARTLEGRS